MKKIIKKSLLALVIASALPAVHAADKSANTDVSSQVEKDVLVTEKLDVNLAEQLGVDGSSSVTVTKAGASRLNIHFSEVSLQPGAYLRISSADGKQTEIINHAALYDGSGESFDSMTIQGDSALVQLIYPDRNSRQVHNDRVIISDFSYSLANNNERAIIGDNQMVDAICYENTKPGLYKGSLAMMRIYVHEQGASYGSGFNLVGNYMVMTSNQVAGGVGNKSHLLEYNFQSDSCNSDKRSDYLGIRTEKVIASGGGGANDYAVYQVDSLAWMEAGIQSIFGNLALNPAAEKLPVGTPVYIPQHPVWAGLKKIADRHDDGDACKIVSGGSDSVAHFNCDSSGSVSGAPVMAQVDNTVAAIHSVAQGNSGPSAAYVYNQIKSTMPWTNNPSFAVVGEGKLSVANRSQTLSVPAEPVVMRSNADVKLAALYNNRLKHFGSYSLFEARLRATGGSIESVNVRMQLRTPCGLTDLNASQTCGTAGTRQLEMNVLPQDNALLTSPAYSGWMTLRVTDRQNNQLVSNLVMPYNFTNYDPFTSPFTPGTQVTTVNMTGQHLETPRVTHKSNFGFVAVHPGQGPLATTTATSGESTTIQVPLKNAKGEVKLVNLSALRKFGCTSGSGIMNSVAGCGSTPASAYLDLRFWYGNNPGLPAGRYTGMLPLIEKGDGVEQAMLVNIDINI
ncbi:trypsin-like serine peptidase [Winslowiella iniecta]|uniref:trypsin-like serine peptidase n=2 Tax=Winslowiella iniecta TaxID=1560201 RepID=UPI000A613040|nr:hypothetical protein [Winslowiella iniecta]